MPTEFEFEVHETVTRRVRCWFVAEDEDGAWIAAATREPDNSEIIEDLQAPHRKFVRIVRSQPVHH